MARRRIAVSLALGLGFCLGLCGAAPRTLSADAQPAPSVQPSPPLLVSADQLDVDVQAKTAVLLGNVRLSRGEIGIACPRVDARYSDAPTIAWAKGSGGVVAELGGARAEAPEVEIDMATQALSLRGGVRISRGGGWLTAERATVNMTTLKITMSDVKGSIPVAAKPSP